MKYEYKKRMKLQGMEVSSRNLYEECFGQDDVSKKEDHNYSYPDPNPSQSFDTWTQSIRIKKSSNNACTTCGKVYTSKGTLRKHIKSVHEGVRYPCTLCGKAFTDPSHLLRHRKLKHMGVEVRYPCTTCGKTYSDQNTLRIHTKSVHEGVKYPCASCFKIYSDMSTLRRHIISKHQQPETENQFSTNDL